MIVNEKYDNVGVADEGGDVTAALGSTGRVQRHKDRSCIIEGPLNF